MKIIVVDIELEKEHDIEYYCNDDYNCHEDPEWYNEPMLWSDGRYR